jgi:glycerol-3-phosphate dehydrogenase (NAD(P)+)
VILSCSSPQSRNFSFGVAIGKGERSAPDTLAEGAFTAAVLVDMAIEKGIDVPVAAAVAAVLDHTIGVDAAIEALLTRPLRAE